MFSENFSKMTSLAKSWPCIVALILAVFFDTSVYGKLHGGRKQGGGAFTADELSAERLEKLMNTTNFKLPLPSAGGASYPLDPLSATEIRLTALIIKMYNRSLKLNFECIGLHEPEKALLISSFLTGTNPAPGSIDRKAAALVVNPADQSPYWVVVNLSTQKVESFTPARPDQHSPYVTEEYQDIASDVVLANPDILKRLSALGFNDLSKIVTDVWEAGYVADNPNYAKVRKLVQVYFYVGLSSADNFFAHPIDFVAYVDIAAQVVRGIEDFPIHYGFDTTDRSGNSVPLAPANFYPPLLPANFLRKDVRPIAISRPQGVSFTINDRQVSWQGFQFRVGFNPREAGIIYHVSYTDDGILRALFYRLSVSEVFFQYGDPRPPYHRKSSFDEGEFELGDSSVSLSGEFCRGSPAYFDAVIHNIRAETTTIKNAICVVEEPDDVLWAYAGSGGTTVKQSQRLAVKSFISVGNSQYLISWRFYQDASVELSIRVTGLLTAHLAAIDIKSPPPPYGTLVAPKVYTLNFQYFMGARVDADIDGVKNTVSMEDMVPVSELVNPSTNPYGNGMITKATVLKTAAESRTDYAPGRAWRISNPNHPNPLNGRPTSYKLTLQGPIVPSLLSSDSPIRDRITWANYNMWVLPFNDSQIFIDNTYLDCGVNTWTNENPTANIQNTDATLWPVFGFAFAPDQEDWPIVSKMPEVGFKLRPSNFFTKNPALSVPPASETTAFDDNAGNQPPPGWGWRTA